MDNVDDEERKVEQVAVVCEVSRYRARDLLEAAGSVQQAIEIHFHHLTTTDGRSTGSTITSPLPLQTSTRNVFPADDETAVREVVSVCEVSMHQAKELLEAAGSIGRAVNLHFHRLDEKTQHQSSGGTRSSRCSGRTTPPLRTSVATATPAVATTAKRRGGGRRRSTETKNDSDKTLTRGTKETTPKRVKRSKRKQPPPSGSEKCSAESQDTIPTPATKKTKKLMTEGTNRTVPSLTKSVSGSKKHFSQLTMDLFGTPVKNMENETVNATTTTQRTLHAGQNSSIKEVIESMASVGRDDPLKGGICSENANRNTSHTRVVKHKKGRDDINRLCSSLDRLCDTNDTTVRKTSRRAILTRTESDESASHATEQSSLSDLPHSGMSLAISDVEIRFDKRNHPPMIPQQEHNKANLAAKSNTREAKRAFTNQSQNNRTWGLMTRNDHSVTVDSDSERGISHGRKTHVGVDLTEGNTDNNLETQFAFAEAGVGSRSEFGEDSSMHVKSDRVSSFWDAASTVDARALEKSMDESTMIPVLDTSMQQKQDAEFEQTKGQIPASHSDTRTTLPSGCQGSPKSKLTLPYSMLSESFCNVSKTTKRNEKLRLLKELFYNIIDRIGGINTPGSSSSLKRQDHARLLTICIALTLGKFLDLKSLQSSSSREQYDKCVELSTSSMHLQVSSATVSAALQIVTGASIDSIRNSYREQGDLGDVAAALFGPQRSRSFFIVNNNVTHLGIDELYELMVEIATSAQGKGSKMLRRDLVARALQKCRSKDEIRFVIRTLVGNMRLGATLKSVLASLAMAVEESLTKKNGMNQQSKLIDRIQRVYNICPRFYEICEALLEGGIDLAEKKCTITVGLPVEPMLANPTQSLQQVALFLEGEDAIGEWKYDGVRCQAHWDGRKLRLFSRHMLDSTHQYPDAVSYLLEACVAGRVQSFIVDAEIVGVRRSNGEVKLLPFQELATRSTSALRARSKQQVQIRVFAFDLMYLNGRSFLNSPLWKRRLELTEHFYETPGFAFAKYEAFPVFDEKLIDITMKKAIADGAEGLMIKLTGKGSENKPSSGLKTYGYEAGERSHHWLKLKRDYIAGYYDTIDVVPIGAWFGNGRKAKKRFLSPILFAVYDDDEGVFHSISRCMSFSDEMYEAIREFYLQGIPYPERLGSSTKTDSAAPDHVARISRHDSSSMSDSESRADEERMGESFYVDSFLGVNCSKTRPDCVMTNESPPIWFKPLEVWEVSFADLSLSRVHTAARDLFEGKGVALRFPRFKRRRPDKAVRQATTTRQIADLYMKQTKIQSV